MGVILLIIASVVEVIWGIFCIKSKSSNRRIKSWINIGEFGIFLILIVLDVVQWSFRWYLFGGILLARAIMSIITLISRKYNSKAFRPIRFAFKTVAIVLIMVLALMPAMIFPQYRLPQVTGKYEVKTAVFTYTDSRRVESSSNQKSNRSITAEFWYPINADKKYPLIVFSHGAFGIRASNTSTFNELASNGYVVCSLDHPYQSFFTVDINKKITIADKSFIQEVIDVNNGVFSDEKALKLEQKWLEVRTQDMNFVLDTIKNKAEEAGSNPVYKLIDTKKIGLLGHSLGGAAAVQLGRERQDVAAVINLDADLLGEYEGFKEGRPVINNRPYTVPLLSIYTDDMLSGFAKAAASGIVVPRDIISKNVNSSFEVSISGTNHMSLTDLPLFSPVLVSMISGSVKKISVRHEADKYFVIETMNKIVLEFFDCYLKGAGSFHSAGAY